MKSKELHRDLIEAASRAPHGERGLKLNLKGPESSLKVSLSSRRAWIEIYVKQSLDDAIAQSLSSRRAWIDIGVCPLTVQA